MPYVRRANGLERAESLRVAFRLAFYQMRRRKYYVMVQHGFPNHAMEVGPSKREVQQKPLPVACGRMTFKQWAKLIQRKARAAEVA